MDIGSEISEKIQMAIKAKLKKINAYVDDELPDYIMIMIANRKPEEQMTEALSLFLGNNTKIFTKWLYELLSGLRENKNTISTDEKQNSDKTVVKELSLSNDSNENSKELTPSIKKGNIDIPKPSRWDVKKESKSSKTDKQVEKNEPVASTKPSVTEEAVIDILPETDDLFDQELANNDALKDLKDGNNVLKPLVSESTTEVRKTVAPVSKVVHTTGNKSSLRSKPTVAQNDSKPHVEKNEKKKIDKKNNDSKHESYSGDSTHSSQSNQKRSVSIKTSKHSTSIKETTKQVSSNKEPSSQIMSSKSKRKKLKRSNDKESSHKHKSSKSHIREWDKDKGRKQLVYSDSSTYSKKYETKPLNNDDIEDDLPSTKQVSSRISSSVSSVTKPPLYVSEDDSDDGIPLSGSVISKVAVPERRSRLPPSKQANRSLLLKAVHEAESSIKKHQLAHKILAPVSEKTFKSKVEQHKKLAVDNLGHVSTVGDKSAMSKTLKLSVSSNVAQNSKTSDNELQAKSKPKNLKRKSTSSDSPQSKRKSLTESNILQSNKDIDNKKTAPQPLLDKKDHSKQFGDSRRIISRDSTAIMNKEKKTIVQKSIDDSDNSSVYFDARKLTSKSNTNDTSSFKNNIQSTNKNKRDIKTTDDVAEHGGKKIKQSRKSRAESPCFIVTLDGTSKSENFPSNTKSEIKSVPFCPSPVQPPDDAESTLTSESYKKLSANSKQSNLENKTADNIPTSDLDLSNMRAKLLRMQEETKKLKDIQLKHQALLQKKIGDKSLNPDGRSIHIANVHFSATEKQLTEHFSICGKVIRVTILKDPFSGHSKGFAYLEFEDEKSVDMAMALDGTSFCGRNISISRKQNELAGVSLPFAPSRGFVPRGQRFMLSRQYRRYNMAASYVSSFRSWAKPTLTKNKTWVKPGFIPS